MKIKCGYNDKETEIRLCKEGDSICLWIIENGKDDKETLSYMTPNELVELFEEVKQTGKDLFN